MNISQLSQMGEHDINMTHEFLKPRGSTINPIEPEKELEQDSQSKNRKKASLSADLFSEEFLQEEEIKKFSLKECLLVIIDQIFFIFQIARKSLRKSG